MKSSSPTSIRRSWALPLLISVTCVCSAAWAGKPEWAGNGHGNGHGYGNGHGNGHAYGHGNYRPGYAAPARNYYAPARGYWRGGRWVAPVVVGGIVAAAVGSAYAYSTPGYAYDGYSGYSGYNKYVAPSYYTPAAVTYAAPVNDGFEYADANRDGYVSFDEAAVNPHWQRNFGNIDRNRDGYLSRDEVAGWRYR